MLRNGHYRAGLLVVLTDAFQAGTLSFLFRPRPTTNQRQCSQQLPHANATTAHGVIAHSRGKNGLTAVEVVVVIAILALSVAMFLWIYQRFIRPEQVATWLNEQPERLLSLDASAVALKDGKKWIVTVTVTNTSADYLPLVFTPHSFLLLADGYQTIPVPLVAHEDLRLAETRDYFAYLNPDESQNFTLYVTNPPKRAKVIFVPKPFIPDAWSAASNPPDDPNQAPAHAVMLENSTLKSKVLNFGVTPE